MLLLEPATERNALNPAEDGRDGTCSAAVAPPPVVVGGEGGDRAGNEGRAELGGGVDAPGGVGEGAIDLSGPPPMGRCGREGGVRAGIEQWAELGNGVAAPVVAGKGAINPAKLLPIFLCGREGAAASTVIQRRSHNAEHPGLFWRSSRIRPKSSAYWSRERQ